MAESSKTKQWIVLFNNIEQITLFNNILSENEKCVFYFYFKNGRIFFACF